jgi:gluconolactonase
MKQFLLGSVLLAILSCGNPANTGYKTIGNIEVMDTALYAIVDTGAKAEIIAKGFEWSEGPLWLEDRQMLLFSDVPANIVYKWTAEKGKEIYLERSGYTGTVHRGGEIGSNGLLLNNKGQLVLCQHGDRRVALMEMPLDTPVAIFKTIAGSYQSKKFNSPNDAVYNSRGDLFFTDPPYGLERNMQDSLKEIPFQGVYKVNAVGEITLLTDSVSRPNGIALTPDEKTLLVANSDGKKPVWYAFDFDSTGALIHPRIFYDATAAAASAKGSPDGMKIDRQGNVFATGPGGIWIFNKNGKPLGRINIPENTSNCAFSKDEKTLYVTADMYVLRIKLRG